MFQRFLVITEWAGCKMPRNKKTHISVICTQVFITKPILSAAIYQLQLQIHLPKNMTRGSGKVNICYICLYFVSPHWHKMSITACNAATGCTITGSSQIMIIWVYAPVTHKNEIKDVKQKKTRAAFESEIEFDASLTQLVGISFKWN